MVSIIAPYIGPDTVDLVFHDSAATFDTENQLINTERVVPKSNCAITVGDGTSVGNFAGGASAGVAAADANDGSIAVYVIKAMLPVDDDTTVLTGNDALRFDGITYQLNRDATVKYTFRGQPDHVRAFGSAQFFTNISAELVVVTPRSNRDASGQPVADGTPREVTAWAVSPGNTSRRYGIAGDEDEADFTVAMPIDDPISDNDGMLVRGRFGVTRVAKQFNRWPDRQVKVCTVRTVSGGRTR